MHAAMCVRLSMKATIFRHETAIRHLSTTGSQAAEQTCSWAMLTLANSNK